MKHAPTVNCEQAHHILAEIIQGGLVLETNGDEISNSGPCHSSSSSPFISATFAFMFWFNLQSHHIDIILVKLASKARRSSFTSANPLSLSSGGSGGPRSGSLQTPLGWLTGRLAGVATRGIA